MCIPSRAENAKIAEITKQKHPSLFAISAISAISAVSAIFAFFVSHFFIGAEVALSISSGALRFCRDERAARATASRKTPEKTHKKICDRRIFASARAALLA
jgi:hypothetical protein